MDLEPFFVPGVIVVMATFMAVLGIATFVSRGPR
jgi:hypothetical protein